MHLWQMHSVGPHIHANIGTAANSPLGRAINGTAAHALLTAANREPLRYGVRDSRKELTSADSFLAQSGALLDCRAIGCMHAWMGWPVVYLMTRPIRKPNYEISIGYHHPSFLPPARPRSILSTSFQIFFYLYGFRI
jgi:hypothetical protein